MESFLCEMGCGRQFPTQTQMLEHVKRRHQASQLPKLQGKAISEISDSQSVKSGRVVLKHGSQPKILAQLPKGTGKLQLLRPRITPLPSQTSIANDQEFRDSRIDFNLPPRALPPRVFNAQKPKPEMRSQSKGIIQEQRVTTPISSSLVKDLNIAKPDLMEKDIEKDRLCQQEQNIDLNASYTTTDILESKKKLQKPLFFAHGGYEQFDKITHLFLRQQGLLVFESTKEVPFKQLSSLKSLSLSHNKLINVIGISELTGIQELNLNHNNIHDISPLSFCKMLQRLWVNHNQIDSIHQLGGMIHLEILCVGYNQITSFDKALAALKLMPSLREFEIQGNPCTNRYEYKYDLLWQNFLEKLDNQQITEQDYQLARAFHDNSGQIQQDRPVTAPRAIFTTTDDQATSLDGKSDDEDSLGSRAESLQCALDEAYQENYELRIRLEKLEQQNKEFRAEAEKVPFLQEEVQKLRTQMNSYETLMIFKDSSEGDLMRQIFNLNAQVEQLKIENEKIKNQNNDLLEDNNFDQIKQNINPSLMRGTISTQMDRQDLAFNQEEECKSESDDEKYFKDDENQVNKTSQEVLELMMRNSLTLSQMKSDLSVLKKK